MSEIILEINNLSKSYGKITALNNFSISVSKGTVLGILGPNGSGKTTTLAIITGLLQANNGSFSWFGKPFEQTQLRNIGVLIETPCFYLGFSAKKNLELICKIKDLPESEALRVLQVVNLYERRLSAVNTYSLGMKQRLAIAAALLGDPQVLVLDEPTNGLDPEGIAEVREIIINEAAKGKTIILASHLLDEVEKVCNDVAILKKGNLMVHGKVNQIIDQTESYLIASPNLDNLEIALLTSSFHRGLVRFDDHFEVKLHKEYNIEDLSKFLLEKGIVLTKIMKQPRNLEKYFLEVIHS